VEPPKSSSSSRGAREDDDDDDGLFLTQGDDDYDGDDDDAGGAKVYDGTRMDAPVRHVAFNPHSGTSLKGKGAGGSSSERFPYFLAIASESNNSPVAIADVTDKYTAGDAARVRLAGASGGEHRGGGVCIIAYSPLPAPSDDDDGDDDDDDDNDDDDDKIVLLASMGMDGRIVVWDVSSPDAQSIELDWDVIMETTKRTAGMGGSTSGTSTSRAVRVTPSR